MRKYIFFCLLVFLGASVQVQSQTSAKSKAPKNIIFFIGDGMGYNHVKAASYFQHGEAGKQVYDAPEWVKLGLATFPSVLRKKDGQLTFAPGYDPQKAWEDPMYVAKGYTDSGAGGTALASGRKTYYGAIGVGVVGDTLLNIGEAAKAIGKSTGVVSSVQMSHATPASFVAHNEHRNNYAQIAQYMLFESKADVIIATGNPDFNDDAKPAKNDAQYVGGPEVWQWLKSAKPQMELRLDGKVVKVKDVDGDGIPDPWVLVQDSIEFVKLMTGPTPKRVLGLPKVYSTLQQGRSVKEGSVMPYETSFNRHLPSLEQMTMAAINILSKNEKGFFVMVEGGAIDWASHSHQADRLIEEQTDFNKAIEAAVKWVETYSSWEETLIVITADHECGYLTAPGEGSDLFKPVVNNGKGKLPGMQFNHDNHTNVLVPFYARGAGSHLFEVMAGYYDPVRGPFIQNIDVPNVIFMMWGKP